MATSTGAAAVFTSRVGRVVAFDDHMGSGTIRDRDTGEEWYLHCTRIADGTRSIPVGDTVTFEVVPGPTGFEAASVRRAPA